MRIREKMKKKKTKEKNMEKSGGKSEKIKKKGKKNRKGQKIISCETVSQIQVGLVSFPLQLDSLRVEDRR